MKPSFAENNAHVEDCGRNPKKKILNQPSDHGYKSLW